MTTTDQLLALPPYSLKAEEKDRALLEGMNRLTELHAARCPEYRQLIDVLHGGFRPATRLQDVPYVPVGLFKTHRLVSVHPGDVFKTLTSSGTTSQQVSTILLDRLTAQRQSAALVRIMTYLL